jgi:hypothetical protein
LGDASLVNSDWYLVAKISKTVEPYNIRLASGARELAPAAIDALREKRYISGEPIEVERTLQGERYAKPMSGYSFLPVSKP